MIETVQPRAAATTPQRITLADVQQDPVIRALLLQADAHLAAVGAPEAGMRHHELVSRVASDILCNLHHPEREVALAAIAGYMHDIGNVVCRQEHPASGGYIAMRLLERMGMDITETAAIAAAIANHDDDDSEPVSGINAALVIANFADVHRSRVRNPNPTSFTPFDAVNYAVINSAVEIDTEQKLISVKLTIDTTISPVLDYFNLYLGRMLVSRRAAQFLACTLALEINKNRML